MVTAPAIPVMTRFRRTGSLSTLLSLLALACAETEKPTADPEGSRALAAPLCAADDAPAVAPSADGARVAFVSCSGSSGPQLVVHELASGKSSTLGSVREDASVEWLLDGEHLLVGSAEDSSVVPADGSGELVRVATGTVLAHRIFLQKFADADFRPRLLILEEDGETRRVTQRKPDDGYSTPTLVYEDASIANDLSQLSASGRTLILTVDPQGEDGGYVKQLLDDNLKNEKLPFGPKSWAMAPVGLGDTHNYALNGDELIRIRLDKNANYLVIVPAGSGLLEGTEHLISRESEPGFKHVYYIVNGDPTRRVRQPETDGEPLPEAETLAEANAIAQVMSPDEVTLLFLSDGQLSAVHAEGGPTRLLVEEEIEGATIPIAFSSAKKDLFKKKPEFAYLANETLYRGSLADDSLEVLSGPAAVPGTVAYDGAQGAILYLTADGELERVRAGEKDAEPVAASVGHFWAVPGSADVLVASSGQLELIALDEK